MTNLITLFDLRTSALIVTVGELPDFRRLEALRGPVPVRLAPRAGQTGTADPRFTARAACAVRRKPQVHVAVANGPLLNWHPPHCFRCIHGRHRNGQDELESQAASPCSSGRASPPIVLPQPNCSSIRLRARKRLGVLEVAKYHSN
jgi:hypothetical protein